MASIETVVKVVEDDETRESAKADRKKGSPKKAAEIIAAAFSRESGEAKKNED